MGRSKMASQASQAPFSGCVCRNKGDFEAYRACDEKPKFCDECIKSIENGLKHVNFDVYRVNVGEYITCGYCMHTYNSEPETESGWLMNAGIAGKFHVYCSCFYFLSGPGFVFAALISKKH